MKTFNYGYDNVTGEWRPGAYPGRGKNDWVLPDEIRTDHSKLNSVIEVKYTREFLKVCAFYNKLFPSLKHSSWVRSTYNSPPFTAMDQERTDTGTGISSNYLKQIIDQVTARLGTIDFSATLISEIPTLEYILYKDEVERLIRKEIKNEKMNQMTLEMFHNAAVLGFSHAFINPFDGRWLKANDWELGFYESQFNRGVIRQLLYRDYAYPATEIDIYLKHATPDTVEKILDDVGSNNNVDLKMYFDCPNHKVHVTINNTTIEAYPYPFDEVQMVTFAWDTGFAKTHATSLFDLLYPVQRELNKVNAKLQQLIRVYKGAVPVFNSDVDLAMKAISNGSGEALYVDSQRPIDTLMTVINPTPLDQQLSAEKDKYKTEMYELAGIQQVSFDMENMRSAAAVIALDQTRDTTFQAQMFSHAQLKTNMLKTMVNYLRVVQTEQPNMDWDAVYTLLMDNYIELKPTHSNDPLGLDNGGDKGGHEPTNYLKVLCTRVVKNIIKDGNLEIPLSADKEIVLSILAYTMLRIESLGLEVPEHVQTFMMSAFIEDIKLGKFQLIDSVPVPMEQEQMNGQV